MSHKIISAREALEKTFKRCEEKDAVCRIVDDKIRQAVKRGENMIVYDGLVEFRRPVTLKRYLLKELRGLGYHVDVITNLDAGGEGFIIITLKISW